MKRILLFVAVFLAGCQLIPTPNDFPPPPSTLIIVEPTFPVATATLEPHLRPITESDMVEARTFFLIIQTQVMAGDDYGFAEKVHFPIQVVLNGQKTIFSEPGGLAENLRAILTDKMLDAIMQTSEDDLLLLPDGIRVGHGELWFNLFCTDLACSDSQFLVTQINN